MKSNSVRHSLYIGFRGGGGDSWWICTMRFLFLFHTGRKVSVAMDCLASGVWCPSIKGGSLRSALGDSLLLLLCALCLALLHWLWALVQWALSWGPTFNNRRAQYKVHKICGVRFVLVSCLYDMFFRSSFELGTC